MENKPHAFLAGLFTIGLLAVIGLVVFFFSFDRTVREPYDLIATSSVTGLSPDADVRFRGLDVGKVQSIRFDPRRRGQIVIRILVDAKAPITRSTFATLGLQGVTGIAFVQLDDTGIDESPLHTSSEAVAQLPLRPGLLDQLQQRGEALLRKLDSLADEANAMLSEPNRQQMIAAVASLQQAADSANTLMKQLTPATGELRQTLRSTNALVQNLNSPNGALQTNLNKAGTAAAQAGAALQSMNESIGDLSARVGYNTLPRVDSLTDDVRSAVRSVNRAADTFSANPRSVLFGGAPQPAPGPGEAGFAWPAAHGAK